MRPCFSEACVLSSALLLKMSSTVRDVSRLQSLYTSLPLLRMSTSQVEKRKRDEPEAITSTPKAMAPLVGKYTGTKEPTLATLKKDFARAIIARTADYPRDDPKTAKPMTSYLVINKLVLQGNLYLNKTSQVTNVVFLGPRNNSGICCYGADMDFFDDSRNTVLSVLPASRKEWPAALQGELGDKSFATDSGHVYIDTEHVCFHIHITFKLVEGPIGIGRFDDPLPGELLSAFEAHDSIDIVAQYPISCAVASK
jgi:hypothetical protein